MPSEYGHVEARECGCRILHRRVYVCEKHAALPEKVRDKISEMASRVVAEEIAAAITLERNRIIRLIEDEQAFLSAGDKTMLVERIREGCTNA